jgi:rubredoxin
MSLRTSFADSDQEVLANGFSPDKGEEAQDEDFKCPHCGVVINGKEDVVLLGDSSCCIKCNKPLFEQTDSTPIVREDTDAIGREEFSAYWDEVMSLEDGDNDYEVDD